MEGVRWGQGVPYWHIWPGGAGKPAQAVGFARPKEKGRFRGRIMAHNPARTSRTDWRGGIRALVPESHITA